MGGMETEVVLIGENLDIKEDTILIHKTQQ